MLLACKFEEVNPLAIDEFVYISDGAYSKDEVVRMESMVRQHAPNAMARSSPCGYPPACTGLPLGPDKSSRRMDAKERPQQRSVPFPPPIDSPIPPPLTVQVLGKLDFSLSAGTSKAFLKGYEEIAPLDAPCDEADEQRCHAPSSYQPLQRLACPRTRTTPRASPHPPVRHLTGTTASRVT